MPHLILEYSSNVADRVDIDGLVDAVHDAALATGIAPLDALRTRAVERRYYAIADRHADNAFVALVARLGAGRTDDTGDLWWPGQTLTLQVKNYRNITIAVADGLDGATRQQANAGTPYGAAMIRRPGGNWFFAQTVEQFTTMYRETL